MRFFSTAGYKITRFSEFRICKLVFFCQFEHFLGQKRRILKKCVKCVKVCVLKTKADLCCVCWDHEKIENTTTLRILPSDSRFFERFCKSWDERYIFWWIDEPWKTVLGKVYRNGKRWNFTRRVLIARTSLII